MRLDNDLNYDQCPRCNFVPFKWPRGNSSSRDVVLTFGYKKLWSLPVFIRTLRTTNTKARIVIIISTYDKNVYNKDYFDYCKKCGVQFIDIGPLDLKNGYDIFYTRHYYFNEFFKSNRDKIDRVICSDLYDTIFQHDPFTTDINESYFHFSTELVQIKKDPFWATKEVWKQKGLLLKLNPPIDLTDDKLKLYHENQIVNGGLYGGSLNNIIKFEDVMSRIGDSKTMRGIIDDQFALMVFHSVGVFDPIFKHITNYGQEYLMTSICHHRDIKRNCFRNGEELGNFTVHGRIVATLHQFDRYPAIIDSIRKICPDTNRPPIPEYMRTMYYYWNFGD